MIALEQKPYALVKTMILMYQKKSEKDILPGLRSLNRDELPFFVYEISQIFKQFDPNGKYNGIRSKLI